MLSLFQRTALSVEYSVSLPTASPASRGSAQNVTDCTTPTPKGPTTVEQLSHHHQQQHHHHHHPKTGTVTGQAIYNGYTLIPLFHRQSSFNLFPLTPFLAGCWVVDRVFSVNLKAGNRMINLRCSAALCVKWFYS